ncbi:MAG: hypothetical protein JW749_06910 [Sedimentisphaerales bacterium]|nr:hypothetical protein [Sedimentisphaerales bacterium]
MSKDSRISHLYIIAFVHSFLLLGMALCGIVEFCFLEGKNQLLNHPFWSKVFIAFLGGYMVLLVVVVPIEIFVFGRKERKGQALPKFTIKDLICLPFGAANPNAEIPKWIKVPVLSILFLLLCILVFFLVMLLITHVIF